MGNIYEAVEQAYHDNTAHHVVGRALLTRVDQLKPNREGSNSCCHKMNSNELATLVLTIDQLLPNLSRKTIMVTGSQQGAGVSTVACEMAKVAAARLGKRVLLLDADTLNPSQHLLFNLNSPVVLKRRDSESGGEYGHSLSANLCVATLPRTDSTQSGDESSHSDLFEELKHRFDLIVVDSSSSLLATGQTSLVENMDGVLFVVAAEKTEWSGAEALIAEVKGYGGVVLGVVFNRQRVHIPRTLSSWLTTVGKLLEGRKGESPET